MMRKVPRKESGRGKSGDRQLGYYASASWSEDGLGLNQGRDDRESGERRRREEEGTGVRCNEGEHRRKLEISECGTRGERWPIEGFLNRGEVWKECEPAGKWH